jgi:hypothetical protein
MYKSRKKGTDAVLDDPVSSLDLSQHRQVTNRASSRTPNTPSQSASLPTKPKGDHQTFRIEEFCVTVFVLDLGFPHHRLATGRRAGELYLHVVMRGEVRGGPRG